MPDHVPTDRFSILDRRLRDRADTVRPKAYLRGARLSGGTRALTNRDQLAFELLLTVAGQADPQLRSDLHSVPIPAFLAAMPAGTRLRDALASLDRLMRATIDLACLGDPDPIQPLLHFQAIDGTLSFMFDEKFRSLLDRTRKKVNHYEQGLKLVQWQHMNLDRMRTFGSGYTAPLYRHIVSIPGGSHIPRTIEQTLSFEDVAAITSLRLQKTGGFKGQVDAVLSAAQRDFDRDQSDIRIRMRWRGAEGRFLDTVHLSIDVRLPDLRRIRSMRLVSDEEPYDGKKLSPDDTMFIARPDEPRYRGRIGTWTKVAALLNRKRPCGPILMLYGLSTALDLAIDELERMDEPDFQPTTEGFHTSPVRGERLRELIELEGMDRAAVLFCLEEDARPDLTSGLERSMAKASGRETQAMANRIARYKRSIKPPLKSGQERARPTRVPARSSMYDEASLAALRARKIEEIAVVAAKRVAEAEDRAERRARKKRRKADERNARRREVRAEMRELRLAGLAILEAYGSEDESFADDLQYDDEEEEIPDDDDEEFEPFDGPDDETEV